MTLILVFAVLSGLDERMSDMNFQMVVFKLFFGFSYLFVIIVSKGVSVLPVCSVVTANVNTNGRAFPSTHYSCLQKYVAKEQ